MGINVDVLDCPKNNYYVVQREMYEKLLFVLAHRNIICVICDVWIIITFYMNCYIIYAMGCMKLWSCMHCNYYVFAHRDNDDFVYVLFVIKKIKE